MKGCEPWAKRMAGGSGGLARQAAVMGPRVSPKTQLEGHGKISGALPCGQTGKAKIIVYAINV